jgi:hypothetical protein
VFLVLRPEVLVQTRVLGILSIVWIILAVLMLYRSASIEDKRKTAQYEQVIAILALLAMITALNSVPLFGLEKGISVMYEALALILLIAASMALFISTSATLSAKNKKENAEIEGIIKYVGEGKMQSPVLYSERYGLRGRPDYIIEVEGQKVPVEVKT